MAVRREAKPPPPADGERRPRRWRRAGDESLDTGAQRTPESPAAVEQQRLIAEALGELGDLDVREVMTPRVDVVALTIPVSADDIARAVRETGHSGFPVVNGDLDDLVGVLFVNDLFRTGRRPGAGGSTEPSTLDISRRFRQPFVVPETSGVLEALAEMRRQHRAFAVVVDEYGGVAGVITVKDLLEPIVGDLHDEFDADDEPELIRVDPRRWLIDGQASVDSVRDRLAVDLPDGDYVTLGGYLFDVFDDIPQEGERHRVGEWEFKVVEMDRRRIAKVVAKHLEPQAAGGSATDGNDRRDATPDRAPAQPGNAGATPSSTVSPTKASADRG